MRKITGVTFLLLFICLTSGCSVVSDEKKEKVLEQDPHFRQLLEEKKRTDAEIAALKKALKERRAVINSKIDILKKGFRKESEKVASDIKRLESRFDSEKDIIAKEIELVKQDMDSKQHAIKNADKTINELNGLITKEGKLDISQEEVNRWRQRIRSLEEEKKATGKELRKTEKELGLLQIKLKLLR